MSNEVAAIIGQLDQLSPEQKQAVLAHLRQSCAIHPLERDWHAPAEMILEAISQSGDLTQRGVKGVIADRAFHNLVIPRLAQNGWLSRPIFTDEMYDADLERDGQRVTVQVKMQRREAKAPKVRFAAGVPHWVVEVQKTRSGLAEDGSATRPYAFGSFDILAVNLYASCDDWSCFTYAVADWLIPRDDQHLIAIMQPVAQKPNEYWTTDFEECVKRLRSGEKRTLPPFDRARRGGRLSAAPNSDATLPLIV